MADIVSPASYTKLNDVEISNEQPVTTSLFTKFGGNVNKLIDDIGTTAFNVVRPTNGTYGWSYDAVSNRTYMSLFQITKTRNAPVLIYFPVNTFSNDGIYYRETALTTFSHCGIFRSTTGTPNGATDITQYFSQLFYDGASHDPYLNYTGSYNFYFNFSHLGNTGYRTYITGSAANRANMVGTFNHSLLYNNAIVDPNYATSGTYTYGIYFKNVTGDRTSDSSNIIISTSGFAKEL